MLYVISGCSCGGKTTLVNALASRDYRISDEPGRSVVRAELDCGGGALPWKGPVGFAARYAELSVHLFNAAAHSGDDAVAEYDRLVATCTLAGYSIKILPKVSVPERVDFIHKYIQ